MFVRYGSFAFQPWEAGLSVRSEFVRSLRGFKQYQRVRYDIDVDLCISTGQADIKTRIDQIIAAFSTDDQDIGLYHDNGTKSSHFMSTTTNNLTGNQVIYSQFPQTEMGEYASGRKIQLGVSALLLDGESGIIAHRDSLKRVSNAGPQWAWKRRHRAWGHYAEMVFPSTLQVIIHSGYRIGLTDYPLPVDPYYSPPFELNHLRKITHTGPDRHPKGYTGFRVDWEYHYRLPTFDDVTMPYLT